MPLRTTHSRRITSHIQVTLDQLGQVQLMFRLDIVHIKRSIGIRSKIYKPVSEVLQPIMARYLPDTPMQEVH